VTNGTPAKMYWATTPLSHRKNGGNHEESRIICSVFVVPDGDRNLLCRGSANLPGAVAAVQTDVQTKSLIDSGDTAWMLVSIALLC